MNTKPTSKFSLVHVNKLLEQAKEENDEHVKKAKEYICQYFFPTLTGIFYFDFIKQEFSLTKKSIMVPNYIASDVIKKVKVTEESKIPRKDGYYISTKTKNQVVFKLTDYLDSIEFLDEKYDITIDPTSDKRIIEKTVRVGGTKVKSKYINMMPSRMYEHSPYADFDDKVKEKCDLMLKHINDVWANGNKKVYDYIINWLSCTVVGHQVMTYLYLQSNERTGKSFPIEFFRKYVLGERTCLMTSDTQCINEWTKPLEGCLLVNFNELPCESLNQWKSTMDHIKSLVTETTFTCKEKNRPAYQQTNTFNIIITTNNNAITLSPTAQSRIMALDVAETYKGDHSYFNKLANAVMNETVGEAFYCFLVDHYNKHGKKFNSEDRPITETFKLKMTANLPIWIQFLKDEYVRLHCDINCQTKDLYDDFVVYCRVKKRNPLDMASFGKTLSEIGVRKTRPTFNGSRVHWYNIGWQEIYKVFDKMNYIHSNEDINVEGETSDKSEFGRDLDVNSVISEQTSICVHEQSQIINEQNDRIRELENMLMMYQSKIFKLDLSNVKEPEPKTEPEPEEDNSTEEELDEIVNLSSEQEDDASKIMAFGEELDEIVNLSSEQDDDASKFMAFGEELDEIMAFGEEFESADIPYLM